MRRWLVSCLVAGLTCAPTGAEQPADQKDRRNRMFPELVVESGGRQGTCDVLAFTGDGKYLVAAGDDKVARVWAYRDGRLDRPSAVLRWSVWREQRGAIYALALSPGREGRRVAIGGLGSYPTTAAVLDRLTGEVLHTVFAIDPKDKNLVFGSVRALAFSPKGERIAFGSADGSVWLWRPESKRADALRRLGPRVPPRKGTFNYIRLVRFLDEQRLLSVAQNGQVLEWDLTGESPEPRELPLLEDVEGNVFEVKVSADGKWLAATAATKPFIAVRSLDGKRRKDIALVAPQVAVSLAFDAAGRRLAVGIRSHVPFVPNETKFILEGDDQIRLYDLSGKEPMIDKELPHSWRVDCLTFHPDGKHLAVAGGENHEVTLWDLDRPKEPIRELRGEGTGLWSVALSKGGRFLAFQTQRDPKATHPNRRGRGPWTVFDLRMRHFHRDAAGFKPQPPREEQSGWQIVPTKDPYVWKVKHDERGIEHALPLNKAFESMPRCFAFLPRREGKPVRVAIGHYYGVSVFEVRPEGVRRIWVGAGHQGEVMALAVSADGEWLVSASNDQTISAWKLDDRPRGSELGTRFRVKGGRVFIDKVDLFGPAWEAGLVEKEEVVQLMVGPKLVFRRPNAGGDDPPKGDAADCMKELAAPEPGQSLSFRIRRDGGEVVKKLSTVRRRPLWRFFPTRKNEWVLWMWGQHYYDTSTNGDSLLGWQINRGDKMERTPSFHKAERFRDVFQQEAVIERLLLTRDRLTALQEIEGGLQPPKIGNIVATVVRLEPRSQRVNDTDVKVNITIEPRTGNDDYAPKQAELWINDHRLQVWEKLNGKALRTTVTIKRKSLRAGANDLVLQCYNKVQGRGRGRVEESASVYCDRVVGPCNLYGLVVGVSDYKQSAVYGNGKPPPGVGVSASTRSADKNAGTQLANLPTAQRDAEAIRQACLDQEGLLYGKVEVGILPTKQEAANRKTILKKLKELAGKAGPDDRVFLFFAGHGTVLEREGKKGFVFCCSDFSDFNRAKAAETSLDARELQEALADISCRKIVFLDACRAGHLAGQPVRDLTPGGRGPIILAACDRGESSYEIKGQPHAVFATAILEAAGEGFRRADRNDDKRLDPQELYDYTFSRVPELLRKFDPTRSQTPSCFPPELERYPLVRQKAPKKAPIEK